MPQIILFTALVSWQRHLKLPPLDALWNRGLPPDVHITLDLRWPLILLPIFLLNQLLAPHPIWTILIVSLLGLYLANYGWVRSQAHSVYLSRERQGSLLVVGDALEEQFVLINQSVLPVLWVEFQDMSDLPDYNVSQVVASAGNSQYRWHNKVTCQQRGLYQLGPARFVWSDPFRFFTVVKNFDEMENILIYPRVVELPEIQLPPGTASGTDRRRHRPLHGTLRATSVRHYQPGDSLRYIHWPITARHNSLMVTEQDTEPSGEVWIVLDLNQAVQQGEGESGTLEFSIIVAASLASALITGPERRSVGLITTTSRRQLESELDPFGTIASEIPIAFDAIWDEPAEQNNGRNEEEQTIVISPQPGQAQLWRILASLASVQATHISLERLLQSNRHAFGRGRTLIVITPQIVEPAAENEMEQGESQSEEANALSWLAELVHIQGQGLNSSVVAITHAPDSAISMRVEEIGGMDDIETLSDEASPTESDQDGESEMQWSDFATDAQIQLQSLLARYDISTQVLDTSIPLRPILTYRRTRRIIRTTPSGGAVTIEVEEEIG